MILEPEGTWNYIHNIFVSFGSPAERGADVNYQKDKHGLIVEPKMHPYTINLDTDTMDKKHSNKIVLPFDGTTVL